MPAIVRETSDTDLLRDALIENLHREQLNPLEEAAAYQQLLDDFSATHEELARRIGRSRPHISNTIRLLNLPAAVQKRVAAGVLSAGHARALLSVDDPAAQERLAHRIVAEGLSVRAVEEIVAMGAAAGQPLRPSGSGPGRPPVAPGAEGPGRQAVGRLRDAGQGRDGAAQGQDRRRVRLGRRPRADRREHVTRADSRPRCLTPVSRETGPGGLPGRPGPGLGQVTAGLATTEVARIAAAKSSTSDSVVSNAIIQRTVHSCSSSAAQM